MGCAGRLLVAVVVLALFAFGVSGAVAGSWDGAALGGVAWGEIADGAADRLGAFLTGVGAATARGIGWGVDRVAAIPWGAGVGAVARAARGAGSGLVGLLGAAAGVGGDVAGAIWDAATRRAAMLSRAPSGEPLGGERLGLYAAGWIALAALIGWFVLRRLARWGAGAWRWFTTRGCRGRCRTAGARG